MMFDAAAATTAARIAADAHDAVAHDPDLPVDRAAASDTAGGHEIVFIDTSIPDYRQLAAQWSSRGEVISVDAQRDGLAQVEATLAHEHDVAAIHIVSHGDEGVAYAIADGRAGPGRGGTGAATVAVTVAADRPPTIAPCAPVPTPGGRPLTTDVLAGAHDAGGDALTITAASAAAGSVAIGRGGTLVFMPARGFVGTKAIGYTIADGRGGTAPDATAGWLTVDPRGLAIVETGAASDEIHLVVTVVRRDGSRTSTPVVGQRETGEIGLDRPPHPDVPMTRPAMIQPPPRWAPSTASARVSR